MKQALAGVRSRLVACISPVTTVFRPSPITELRLPPPLKLESGAPARAAIVQPGAEDAPLNELILLMSEDAYAGDAVCTVNIDGKLIGDPVTVTAPHGQGSQRVVLNAQLDPGPHTFTVNFTNDAYSGPTKDRNLYVDAATIDNRIVPMAPLRLARGGPCPPVGFMVEVPAFNFAVAFTDLAARMDAGFAAIKAGMAAGAPAAPPAPPPGYSGPSLDKLEVGPGKLFEEIADAVHHANPGALVLVDDGTYKKVFHCVVPNIVISSVSGNPFKCVCDGEGLSGGGKRGAYDKSFMHFGEAFTVIGIGGVNCGGKKSDRNHTNEAFIYAEGFSVPGTARAVRCSADNCGNGWFVPALIYNGQPGPGVNVHWEDEDCVMGSISPNGQSSPDGSASHDCYLSGESVKVTRRVSLGSDGHGIKSRSPITIIDGGYICSAGGRAVEAPDGGTLQVTNATLVARADGNSNFIGFCDESTSNTGAEARLDKCTLVIGRDPSVALIGPTARVTVTNSTVLYYGNGRVQVDGGGTLAGVEPGRPDGSTVLAAAPAPVMPVYIPA